MGRINVSNLISCSPGVVLGKAGSWDAIFERMCSRQLLLLLTIQLSTVLGHFSRTIIVL